jgi:hypothetical protein
MRRSRGTTAVTEKKGRLTMEDETNSHNRPSQGGYVVAALCGAAAGGITVAILSRAIPTMMSRMMGKMMARMSAEGCDPEEI